MPLFSKFSFQLEQGHLCCPEDPDDLGRYMGPSDLLRKIPASTEYKIVTAEIAKSTTTSACSRPGHVTMNKLQRVQNKYSIVVATYTGSGQGWGNRL